MKFQHTRMRPANADRSRSRLRREFDDARLRRTRAAARWQLENPSCRRSLFQAPLVRNSRCSPCGCAFRAGWGLAAKEKTETNDSNWTKGILLGRDPTEELTHAASHGKTFQEVWSVNQALRSSDISDKFRLVQKTIADRSFFTRARGERLAAS